MKRLDMLDCVTSQIAARGLRSVVDANETAVFARELEWIQAGVIEKKYPNLVGANLVPLNGGAIFPGARSHTYREVDSWGEADLLEEYSLDDFPSVEVRGTETTGFFRSFGGKYSYSFEELRARPSLSFDPTQMKANVARRVMEEKLDRLIMSGGGPFKGLLDDTSSTDDTSADDWETGTTAGDVTAIEATFRRVVTNAVLATKGVYTDFDFVLSLKQYVKMNLWVPATTAGGGMTIGQYLLRNVQGVRSITASPRNDGAGAGGKDRLLAFPRDPEVLDALVPIRYEQFAPQLSGMAFVTPAHGKYGGLRIFQPLAIRRADVIMT